MIELTSNLLSATLSLADSIAFWALCVVAVITGLVRGFSGFGTGMIFIPAGAALFTPRLAVVAICIMDSLPALAVVIPALKKVAWRTVLPVIAGFALTVWLGVWILKTFDPVTVRWGISVVVFACVAILITGFAWRGPRPIWASMLVGGIAGITGGAASLPVPAAIAWWRSLDQSAVTTRANMIMFLFLTEILAVTALWRGGLFSIDAVALGIGVSPFYLAGLLVGQFGFNKADEKFYWRIAIAIILASATIGLPLFDGLFT
jgi:hypothetical protein